MFAGRQRNAAQVVIYSEGFHQLPVDIGAPARIMVFAENEYRRLARFRSHGHPVSLVLADLSRRLFIRLTAVEIERPLNESRPPRVPRFAVRKFPDRKSVV